MDIDGIYYCSRCMRRMDEDGLCPHCGHDAQQRKSGGRDLEEGTLLHDRYLLGAVIGEGGFGVTYAAWDQNLQIPVAIKEYFPGRYAFRNTEDSDDIQALESFETLYQLGLGRFRQEAQVMAQFKNLPGVVNINEYFEENNTCYIAMEYVHGVPLDEYVKKHRVDARQLLSMMKQPIDALEIIHGQGIHHRDITPQNMLVQDDGSIKLIDFGSAREADHVTNLIVVSDGYAPVEQYDTQQLQGPWGDIYSLSATLYHMLTGVMPPVSLGRAKVDTLKKPSELGVKLKRHEEKALMAGLAVDPRKRIHSMAEFRSMLYNMPLPEEAKRRKAFKRKVYAAFACMAAVTALALVNFLHGLPLGGGLLYALWPDGWHVTGTTAAEESVVIPSSRLGIPVTGMAPMLFDGNPVIRKAVIPGTIRKIGHMTFYGCSNLEMVTLQSGVKEIGSFAFTDCYRLHTVSVPESVLKIEDSAFTGVWDHLMICGKNGSYAEAFSDRQQVPFYDRADYEYEHVGGRVRFKKGTRASLTADADGYEYADVSEGVRLRWSAESGGSAAAQQRYVAPSYIDGYPVVLLEEGFEFPAECAQIVLPAKLEYLSVGTFNACSYHLTDVDFGDCLKNVPDGMFSDRQQIRSVNLPDTVEIIGDMAFFTVPLRQIRLPASLRHIGGSAFAYTQLNEINFPPKLETIDGGAFSNTALYELRFPESLKEIGSYAFSCTNVFTLDLTIDLDRLGDGAFAYCGELREATIRARNSGEADPGTDMLSESCFEGCDFLYQLTLTGDVKEIGPYAVAYGSTGSSRISLPQGLTAIGEKAFADFEGDAVIIPDSVTQIHDTAFEGSDVKILGAAGSYAQQYAGEHGIVFLDYLKDVIDENGGRIPAASEIVLR